MSKEGLLSGGSHLANMPRDRRLEQLRRIFMVAALQRHVGEAREDVRHGRLVARLHGEDVLLKLSIRIILGYYFDLELCWHD